MHIKKIVIWKKDICYLGSHFEINHFGNFILEGYIWEIISLINCLFNRIILFSPANENIFKWQEEITANIGINIQ